MLHYFTVLSRLDTHLQEDSGNPVAFRYSVTAKHRINTFEPKPSPPDANRTDMRATMLGNTMAGNLDKFSGWDYIRQVWEAGQGMNSNSSVDSLWHWSGEGEPHSCSGDTTEAQDVVVLRS